MLHIIQAMPWLLIAICIIWAITVSPAIIIIGKGYGLKASTSLCGLVFGVSFFIVIILGV